MRVEGSRVCTMKCEEGYKRITLAKVHVHHCRMKVGTQKHNAHGLMGPSLVTVGPCWEDT